MPPRPAFDYPFTENSALNATLAQYELPVVSHTTIENDGYGAYPRLHCPFELAN